MLHYYNIVVVVQLLSHVWLFAIPWIAAHQASLLLTISWSLLKLMSIESTVPSNHLILCCPLLLLPSSASFPASGSFPVSWLFTSGGQSIRALTSVLPMDIQGWFLLGLTGWIFLQSKGLSRVSSPTLHWYNYQKQDVFKKLFWPRSKNAIYSEWVNCLIHVLIFVKNIFLMLSQMSNR